MACGVGYRMNLAGRRFGHLVVLRLDPEPYVSPSGKHKARRWVCRCGCGRAEKSSERAARDGENVFERYDGTTVSAIRPGLKPLKNNTSGVRGVYWEASSQRWVAVIGLRG